MASAGSWIKAFRLRTLPLAFSSILTGSFLAIGKGDYSGTVIFFSLLTTLFLQVLSNLANDYGDSEKGTDNEHRVGPERTVQSGEITQDEMKKGIIVFASLSLISGVALLYFAFGEDFIPALIFFVLGLGAIAASIKYTVGKNAYGYSGLGDLFVFIFFGLVGVLGSYYLNTKSLDWQVLLPAAAMGLFSTGVLNLNNMRDIDNDTASGKKTIPTRIGFVDAKRYHLILILGGWILLLAWMITQKNNWGNLVILIALPLFLADISAILKTTDKAKLDPYLKKLAVKTLLVSLLFGAALLL
jgi:1,4-dihydroxy-2-naphthoate octaprenyltransferase